MNTTPETAAVQPPVESAATSPPTTAAPTSPSTIAPTPPPTTVPLGAPTLADGSLDLDALIAFVEAARERTFSARPRITFVSDPPRGAFEFEQLTNLDWSFVQLLGLADAADRAAFDRLQEQRLAQSGFGRCCPVQAQRLEDLDRTAAIVVHELVHLIDRPTVLGGSIEARTVDTAIIEGNAVRVEEQFVDSIGRSLLEIRPEDDEIPEDAPERLVALVQFPYVEGYAFARAVARANGEAGIDEAIADEPRSAEQIMFPDAYLSGDEPVAVDTPRAPEGSLLARFGTIGAFVLKLAIEPEIGSDAATELVRRWAGDGYAMGRSGGQICIAADVVMDDAASATELAEALDAALTLRVIETSAETVHLEQCRDEVG